jgi:hypothetical protein
MPKAPDWLLNVSANAPDLVEDSPKFRQEEESTQIDNLSRATDEAVSMMQAKVLAAQEEQLRATEAAAARLEAQTAQRDQEQILRQQAALEQQEAELAATEQAVVDTKHNTIRQGQQREQELLQMAAETDKIASGTNTFLPPGFDEGYESSTPEDPATSVLQLSKNLGLDPGVVAALTMLGEDITRLEAEGKLETAPFPGDELLMQQQRVPSSGPVPLAGPPPAPVPPPARPPQAPPTPMPQPGATPMPMVPPPTTP